MYKFHDAQRAAGPRKVVYRPKVKLHGTNAAIRIDPVSEGGAVTAQSRQRDLTPDDDNFGFASWVDRHEKAGNLTPWEQYRVIYGEWYGRGVQKGVALGQLADRHFGVFAATLEGELITEPDILRDLVDDLPCEIIPWHGPAFTLDMGAPDVVLLGNLAAEVERIDTCCPYARDVHQVIGVGEGLVFFPLEANTLYEYGRLAWKAKGRTHRMSGTATLRTRRVTSPTAVSFVDAALTVDRLEQATRETGDRIPANTSAFLKWIGNDVQRECALELAEAGLEWSDVAKTLASKAARWYNARP